MNNGALPREKVSISDIYIEPEIQGSRAMAWIYVEIDNHTNDDQTVTSTVVAKLGEAQEKVEIIETIPPDGCVIEAVIRIEEPEFWWPYGYGEQTLYNCMVGLAVEGEVQDVAEQTFGVRSIRLLESDGQQTLIINEVEIPSTASIWAPPDQFVSNASEQRYGKLIDEAREAGAIMIRAWGEGSEDDAPFYNICDQSGMLVWQELIPEATLTPGEEFMEMVGVEVSEHVKRLRNHPSIVAWCGCTDTSAEDSNNKLLNEMIPDVLKGLDPTRPYLSCCTIPE